MSGDLQLGGPAFHCDSYQSQGGSYVPTGVTGMSVRDYFIAHAPFPPPKWFDPLTRQCPAVPSLRKLRLTEPLVAQLIELGIDADNRELSARAFEWRTQRDAAAELQREWQEEFRRELWLQWPGFYADQMLARRT